MGKIVEDAKDKIQQDNQRKQKINALLIRYFKWLVLALAIIILAMGYFLLIQPKYRQAIKNVELVSQEKELKYLAQQKYLNQLNELKAAYQNITTEDRDKIEAVLPNQAKTEELFAEIEAIVSKNGLILTSLQIEPEANKSTAQNRRTTGSARRNTGNKTEIENLPEGIGKVKIVMNLLGTDYGSLKNIIKTIENNLRLMDIVTLDFSPAENQTSLELFAYYMK